MTQQHIPLAIVQLCVPKMFWEALDAQSAVFTGLQVKYALRLEYR